MNLGRIANLALVLVVIGWLLAYYGVMSQMGDPRPGTLHSVMESHRHVSISILLLGVLCLLASQWLSGYVFNSARKRSLLVLLLIASPVVALTAGLY